MTNKKILTLVFVVAFLTLLVGCLPSPAKNQAPVITTTALPDATVGIAYTTTVVATDADDDVLTFSLVSGPTDMVISGAGVISGWTPAEAGTETVTVAVTDSTDSVSADFTITVEAAPVVNTAPVINSVPIVTATVGVVYTYDVNATDPNGDTLIYSLTTYPSNMTIDSTTGVISWVPISAQVGDNDVIVKVSDGDLSVTQSFTIVVSEPPVDNQPPTINSIPSLTATVGVGYTYTISATDPDGDVLTYSLVSGPAGMVFVTPTISWTPTVAQVGPNGVVVKVSDGALSDTQSFTITVSAVEPEPEIELIGIVVNPKEMTLFVGGSEAIKSVTANYEIRGSEVPIALGDCTFASSATTVATVSDTGLVTAVAEGTATITVSYEGKSDTLEVTVNPVLLTSIVVLPEAMTLSVKGSGTIISVTAHYNDGSNAVVALGDCTYLSDDEAVATVLAGVISAVEVGTATITITYAGMTDTLEVTVRSIRLTSIVVLPETMTLPSPGSETITSVTAHYSDGTEAEIELSACDYESSDMGVATVSVGVVSVVGFGETTITVSYTEEEITKTVYVEKTDTVGVTVGPVHNITQDTYHNTIQDAIDDAFWAGDTIEVAAGEYAESDIHIVKSLTIQGAGRLDTIVDVNGCNYGFYIDTDNVTIKDLTVKNATNRNIVFYTVTVSNATIDNVASLDSDYAGLAVHHSTVNNLVINNSLFSGNALHGIRIDSGGIVQGVTITDSHFDDNGEGGIMSYGSLDGLTIEGGSFTRNAFGIMLGTESPTSTYIRNVYITGVTFDDNNKDPSYQYGFDVYVYNSTEHIIENININDCNITNHLSYGVVFWDGGLAGYESVVIDATNNWWGDASGPTHLNNPGGTGDEVSDNVIYVPFSTVEN